MPWRCPRPERGRTNAAIPGSAMWIAMPVGINSLAPGARSSGRREHGPQIESRGTLGGIVRQRKLGPQPGVQDLDLKTMQA